MVRPQQRAATAPQDRTILQACWSTVTLSDENALSRFRAGQVSASALFEESLTLAHKTGDAYLIKDCLWGLAGVADVKGQSSRLARLWAVAVALDEAVRLLTPDFQPLRRRLGFAVRARLSADEFEAELAKGRATSLDEAVAYALEGVGDLEEPASQ